MPRAGRQLSLWIAATVVVADQITKQLVRSRFDLYDSVTVIPGLLDITRVHNTGAAFGFLNAMELPYKAALVSVVAAAALVGLAIYATMLDDDQHLSRLGLAFIIGGAAGNLVDRVAVGYVLDFVDFYRGGWHFWAFNVADVAINIGVGLMLLDILGVGRHRVSRAV